jgi:formate hydrogenlyase subunit 3/multisubunit Na+/H+ antiporter MnhD subunit
MKTFERERTASVSTINSRKIIMTMYFVRTSAIVLVIFLLFYLIQKLFVYSDATFSNFLLSNFSYFFGLIIFLLLIQIMYYFYNELKNRRKVGVGKREVIIQYAVSLMLIISVLIALYVLNAL